VYAPMPLSQGAEMHGSQQLSISDSLRMNRAEQQDQKGAPREATKARNASHTLDRQQLPGLLPT